MTTLSPDQMPEQWSSVAAGYEHAFEGLSAQFAADTLHLLNLRRGERVIDVAAGTGAFSLLAAEAGSEVVATDFAPGMVSRLRERIAASGLTNIAAAFMDGQNLAVPDVSFDAAVSVLGIIFFPDISKGIGELYRVIRPGGRAAIVCWGDVRKLELMTFMMQAIKMVIPDFRLPATPPVWARLAGEDQLKDKMREAGFRSIAVTRLTKSLQVESPQTFWPDFMNSAPPMASLIKQLGPERTESVGRRFVELLVGTAGDGTPRLDAEACIGIGSR